MKQMTLIEMDGFLKGKCIPSDLKVKETNAEYLARKIYPGSILGLGWGKTLSEMIKSFPRIYAPNSYIVPMINEI